MTSHDRARDGGLLLHAGRQLVAAAVEELSHPEALGKLAGAGADGGVGHAVEAPEVADHLAGGEPRIERGGGREKTHPGPNAVGFGGDVMPRDDRCAAGWPQERGEHTQRGGLAGAVGAKQAVDRAGFDAERHVERAVDFPALLVAEGLGELAGLDHGRSVTASSRRRG
ncbi:MAG: hypothetical protein LW690_10310 [Opitutaceae bacterium]|nr:hypothetical protein [Opitutaceae bacterium]